MMERSIILLVDDNPLLTDAYRAALSVAGFVVHVAHEGREGLRLAEELLPALILLDLRLHLVDGVEVLKRLKANDATGSIPVVIFTVSTGDMLEEQLMSLGAKAVFGKNEMRVPELIENIICMLPSDGATQHAHY
jgi:DNA-binding response OmpR family regulator